MTIAAPPAIDLPHDPGLPAASGLLDLEAATVLIGGLLPGVTPTRVRELRYAPGRSLVVRYRAIDPSGRPVTAVVCLGRDLVRAWTWPSDPGIPGAAGGLDALGRALRSLGGSAPLEILAYRPLERAVLRAGAAVVKLYGPQQDYAAATRAIANASALDVPTAPLLALLPDLRAVVQRRVEGTRVGRAHAHALAPAVARLAARIGTAPIADLPTLDAEAIEARCAAPAATVAAALPWLAPRIARARMRLAATAPRNGALVTAHGDLSIDQVVATPGGPVLVDLDTLCSAPPAYDAATFAANLVSGRPGDLPDATDALAAFAAESHHPLPDLDWCFAAALLRRLDRPIRRAKRNWVERTAAILSTVEEVLP